jgi:broad specificity phosphatase PhoE
LQVEKLYPVEHSHFTKLIKFHGRFWARPPLGESRFDVAKRVHQVSIPAHNVDQFWSFYIDFLQAFGTFHRDAERHGIRDLIIVTHGVTLRAFLMMWLHQSPEVLL